MNDGDTVYLEFLTRQFDLRGYLEDLIGSLDLDLNSEICADDVFSPSSAAILAGGLLLRVDDWKGCENVHPSFSGWSCSVEVLTNVTNSCDRSPDDTRTNLMLLHDMMDYINIVADERKHASESMESRFGNIFVDAFVGRENSFDEEWEQLCRRIPGFDNLYATGCDSCNELVRCGNMPWMSCPAGSCYEKIAASLKEEGERLGRKYRQEQHDLNTVSLKTLWEKKRRRVIEIEVDIEY